MPHTTDQKREYMRRHRAEHPERAKQVAARRRERNADHIKEQKEAQRHRYEALKDGPCADCGGCFPPEAMDWDHVRGEKVKGMGAMGAHVGPMLLAELEKCELVCANCHRIRTRTRRNGAPLGASARARTA